MSSPQQIRTTVTDLLKIKHPVMLAGMNVAAGPKLAAAVTNAGGLGVIGGVSLSIRLSRCSTHAPTCAHASSLIPLTLPLLPADNFL